MAFCGGLGFLPAAVYGDHPAELDDHTDDHFEPPQVHPGHDVDLTSDTEHGEELGDGEDGKDAKVREVREVAGDLPSVDAVN